MTCGGASRVASVPNGRTSATKEEWITGCTMEERGVMLLQLCHTHSRLMPTTKPTAAKAGAEGGGSRQGKDGVKHFPIGHAQNLGFEPHRPGGET